MLWCFPPEPALHEQLGLIISFRVLPLFCGDSELANAQPLALRAAVATTSRGANERLKRHQTDFPGSRRELQLPQPKAVLTFRRGVAVVRWRRWWWWGGGCDVTSRDEQLPPRYRAGGSRHVRVPRRASFFSYRFSADSSCCGGPALSLSLSLAAAAAHLSHHPASTDTASIYWPAE